MSGAPDDDRDLTAAEYAVGALEAAEAHEVERRAAKDPLLAAAIADWLTRLAPMLALVRPSAPPPELWRRLEVAIGQAPAVAPLAHLEPGSAPSGAFRRAWRNPGLWRAGTAAGLALAASLALVVAARPPAAPVYVAGLLPAGASTGFLAESRADRSLVLRALAPVQVAVDKDLELWALPEGAARPVSLGVIPPDGLRAPAGDVLAPKTQLMVSLEPKGGSPTGQPTGPVLYAGTLLASR